MFQQHKSTLHLNAGFKRHRAFCECIRLKGHAKTFQCVLDYRFDNCFTITLQRGFKASFLATSQVLMPQIDCQFFVSRRKVSIYQDQGSCLLCSTQRRNLIRTILAITSLMVQTIWSCRIPSPSYFLHERNFQRKNPLFEGVGGNVSYSFLVSL